MKKIIKGFGVTLGVIIVIIAIGFLGFLGFLKLGTEMGFIKTEVKVTVSGINDEVIYTEEY